MEHKNLWALEGEVPDGDDHVVPIGKARVERRGKDADAGHLVGDGARGRARRRDARRTPASTLEIIDLRTLWPWDKACGARQRRAHRGA